jgi:hypothetical protein
MSLFGVRYQIADRQVLHSATADADTQAFDQLFSADAARQDGHLATRGLLFV